MQFRPYDVAVIVALDDEGAIAGPEHTIPWGQLPTDMERYKRLTTGVDLLCGWRTWFSLPAKVCQAHRDRAAQVFVPPGWGGSALNIERGVPTVCIGGGALYASVLAMADIQTDEPICRKAYITHVKGAHGGRLFFPKLGAEWGMSACGDWITERGHTYRLEYWTR